MAANVWRGVQEPRAIVHELLPSFDDADLPTMRTTLPPTPFLGPALCLAVPDQHKELAMSKTTKRPKVMAKIKKESDLEAHVRTQWVLGHEFVEVRDYVPSTKTYSRGFVIEKHRLGDLIESLQETQERLGGGTSQREIPGQLALFDATTA
jgi:hypothetical protein